MAEVTSGENLTVMVLCEEEVAALEHVLSEEVISFDQDERHPNEISPNELEYRGILHDLWVAVAR